MTDDLRTAGALLALVLTCLALWAAFIAAGNAIWHLFLLLFLGSAL